MKKPDFIIIGAMKCATSSLHAQLAAQEGIFGSDPKEPNFFSDDSQYQRGPEWYFDLFADASSADLAGESSTHYTKLPDYPHTVERMKALLPTVRLVYVMRNPIDRLVSHYIHRWTEKVVDCDINQAVDRFPELVSYSRYSYQLKPYVEAYGRASILPVFLPALRRHPQEQLARVARHIGYRGQARWDEALAAQNQSSGRMRQFRGYELLINSPPMVALRRAAVPRSLRAFVRSKLTMKERPVLHPAVRKRLEHTFDEDLEVLSSWLGAEITCANFDRATANGLDWVDSRGG